MGMGNRGDGAVRTGPRKLWTQGSRYRCVHAVAPSFLGVNTGTTNRASPGVTVWHPVRAHLHCVRGVRLLDHTLAEVRAARGAVTRPAAPVP